MTDLEQDVANAWAVLTVTAMDTPGVDAATLQYLDEFDNFVMAGIQNTSYGELTITNIYFQATEQTLEQIENGGEFDGLFQAYAAKVASLTRKHVPMPPIDDLLMTFRAGLVRTGPPNRYSAEHVFDLVLMAERSCPCRRIRDMIADMGLNVIHMKSGVLACGSYTLTVRVNIPDTERLDLLERELGVKSSYMGWTFDLRPCNVVASSAPMQMPELSRN